MRKAFYQRRATALTLAVVASSFLFYSFSTGITGKTKKNGQGCTCHNSSPSTSVNVVIDGPSQLNTGETGNYTVTITGGTLTRGGTNIAASAGTLIAGTGLQLLSEELTHTSPMAPSNNAVTFSFQFTAPATAGNVTLFANGNSVNFNGSSSGDSWNFADDKIISVSSATDLKDENKPSQFVLEQNFPNPFNPVTKISYQVKEEGLVQLKIYNLVGSEVALLVNEVKEQGYYSVSYDASNLPSGVYIYSLQVNEFVQNKKMTLLK